MDYNFKEDVKINPDNLSSINPLDKKDVKRKKINSKYIYEQFYLIDFHDIKTDSYVISSFGRVFSLITNRELSVSNNATRGNYKSITLSCNNGKRRKFSLCSLMAHAFIPKTESDIRMDRCYAHHKNWDNDYNYIWNLEWRSHDEIMAMSKVQNQEDISEADLAKVVCIFLEHKESVEDIFELLQGKLSKKMIENIQNRKVYKEVSESYIF